MWESLRLEEVVEDHRGGVWGEETEIGFGYPVLRSTNMRGGELSFSDVAWCKIPKEQAEIAKLQIGDIIVTKSSGSPHLVGLPVLFEVNPDGKTYLFSNFTLRLRPNEKKIVPKYLYLYLSGEKATSDRRGMAQDTTGLRNLKIREYLSQEIPLPPLDEQRRIVAKLESILAQIRTARAALHRIPPTLKALRQSVLAAAFRGELTGRDPNDEPASLLLERIRAERRRRWEEAQRARGKDPAQAVYAEPSAPDAIHLPELAEGWVWTTVGEIGEVSGGLTKNANRDGYSLKYPYISVANVYADCLKLDRVGSIGISSSEVERTLLKKGDLLIVEGNGSVDQIGRAAIWDGSIENCLHQNHIIKVRFVYDLETRFVLHWLLSPLGREAIARVASSTSGLYTLSLSKVMGLPIPITSVEEQRRILAKLDNMMKQIEYVEQAVEIASQQVDRIEQSALAKAFRGELL